MSSGLIVALEMLAVLGGLLGFAVWELMSLRKGKPADPARQREAESSKRRTEQTDRR